MANPYQNTYKDHISELNSIQRVSSFSNFYQRLRVQMNYMASRITFDRLNMQKQEEDKNQDEKKVPKGFEKFFKRKNDDVKKETEEKGKEEKKEQKGKEKEKEEEKISEDEDADHGAKKKEE